MTSADGGGGAPAPVVATGVAGGPAHAAGDGCAPQPTIITSGQE
jgi:hypothetical protein